MIRGRVDFGDEMIDAGCGMMKTVTGSFGDPFARWRVDRHAAVFTGGNIRFNRPVKNRFLTHFCQKRQKQVRKR